MSASLPTATRPTATPSGLGVDPVVRRTIADEIRHRITDAVRNGTIAPGARLPAERMLCAELGVARTSLREAVQGLMSTGVLTRRGNRVFVAEHLPDLELSEAHDKTSLHQLFEARRLIEVPMVRLAMERATPEERAAITALAASCTPTLSLEDFMALDRRFHTAIALASGNVMLVEIYVKIVNAWFDSPASAGLLERLEQTSTRTGLRKAITAWGKEHRAMAKIIASGDPSELDDVADTHLSAIESWTLSMLP